MARIVHAADLHIDSSACRAPGTPQLEVRGAARRSVARLVDFVRQIDADLLVIAGDVFDRDADSVAAGGFFSAQMHRLRRDGIRVLAAAGNHDVSCPVAMAHAGGVEWFPTDRAGSHVFDDLAVAVHGRGLADPREPSDLTGSFPAPIGGYANLGVLHTSLDGGSSRSLCAPTSIERLAARGYQYWALGHVHQRRVVVGSPWIVYPGNLQARGPHEPGAKGVTVIDTRGDSVVSVSHHAVAVVRWEQVRVPGARRRRLTPSRRMLTRRPPADRMPVG